MTAALPWRGHSAKVGQGQHFCVGRTRRFIRRVDTARCTTSSCCVQSKKCLSPRFTRLTEAWVCALGGPRAGAVSDLSGVSMRTRKNRGMNEATYWPSMPASLGRQQPPDWHSCATHMRGRSFWTVMVTTDTDSRRGVGSRKGSSHIIRPDAVVVENASRGENVICGEVEWEVLFFRPFVTARGLSTVHETVDNAASQPMRAAILANSGDGGDHLEPGHDSPRHQSRC